MNKAELVDVVAKQAKLTKAAAKDAVDSVFGAMKDALVSGDRISLIGFGSFSVAERKAREGRNPKTGQKIKIAAKKVVKFSPAKELKDVKAKKSKKK